MSDIKQAILDEINTIDKWDEAINGLGMQILSYGQYIHINEVVEVINKHLEGMVIVPREPTELMMEKIKESYSEQPHLYVEVDIEDNYEIAITTFKESK